MTKSKPKSSRKVRVNDAVVTIPGFSRQATKLRSHFDSIYSKPRFSDSRRFVWDYWHVADQYLHHRTLASDFFPKKIWTEFQNELIRFGQDVLGCHSISTPWLSYYTDGCFQNFHTDRPHGPWAYVFSLTEWDMRRFTGGETMILKPEITNFGVNERRLTSGFKRGLESDDIFYRVPSEFNQLLIFDPSLPHGVRDVRGAFDPREARLVVHGWFVNPMPWVSGGLQSVDLDDTLSALIELLAVPFMKAANSHALTKILFTCRIDVDRSGRVKGVEFLTQRFGSLDGKSVVTKLRKEIMRTRFPAARSASTITIPVEIV